jgi:hypothetical protein
VRREQDLCVGEVGAELLDPEPVGDRDLVLGARPIGTDLEALADQQGVDDEEPRDREPPPSATIGSR